jgi:hypothetical protein
MDAAILSASYALIGWLIGGVSTLTASWLTQRWQLRVQALAHEAVKRETLYAEFTPPDHRRERHDERQHGAGERIGHYARVARSARRP